MKGSKKITPRKHDSSLKAKVALEAIRGEKTIAEIASLYSIHPTQIAIWKKQAMEGLPSLFGTQGEAKTIDTESLTAPLYQQIGQLKVELDWLKKKSFNLY